MEDLTWASALSDGKCKAATFLKHLLLLITSRVIGEVISVSDFELLYHREHQISPVIEGQLE